MLHILLATLEPMKDILPAFEILWKGLLAIFVVIGLIIVVVKLTAFCISKAAEAKKRREETPSENNENHS